MNRNPKLSPTEELAGPLKNEAEPERVDSSRVLIIDDNPDIHDDFRKILTRVSNLSLAATAAELFGHDFVKPHRTHFVLDSAYQGNEGLARAKCAVEERCCYAIAFIDVHMPPGWDGIETASQLWNVDPDLQVVICTAYSDYSWEAIAQRLGDRDNFVILKKPFDPIEVLQLAHALHKKWVLTRQAKSRFAQLETRVRERTRELSTANEKLVQDIAERERAEARLEVFSNLNHRLSAAKSAKEAGEIIVYAADQLLGWDACTFALYSSASDKLRHVLVIDTIEGKRAAGAPGYDDSAPSPLARQAILNGPRLILKTMLDEPTEGSVPFGAKHRRSASILLVPVRDASKVVGVLSIHSYTPNAYTHHSLELLQSLADHCAGALERIDTEEALHSAQDRLGHLLRQSPAVIYSFTTASKSNSPGWVSENVVQLVGFSPAECCLPDWWPTHVHPADWGRVAATRSPNSEDFTATLEYRLLHQDGSYRWVRDERRQVRDADGVSIEVVGTWVDVTTQKELEQQLRQSQKMEAIGQLAGGVAHDFNNLLAVILGNTELALAAPEPKLPDQTIDYLKEVSAASARAANLTRQLLAFSRKQILQLRPVDLADAIGNLTKMLKRIIGEDIQLQCSYASRLPMVHADIGMFEQVLLNLAVNSRDAMPQGGELRIHTERRSFTEPSLEHPEARAGEFVCLSVTDTGTGIAPEHLPHLFEPFFTTKEVGKGTGLGLATVHGIVKQHQGWLEVASQPNAGSTFRVFLPALNAAPLSEQAMPIEEPPRGGTETILLVEDDAAVRSLTQRLLQNSGYRVHTAASGPEAIELWNSGAHEFDLLLTDVVMPHGLNGYQLAEQLYTLRPGLKVILMSGYSGDAIAKSGWHTGPRKTRLLQKPCRWPVILRVVRECLDEQ